MAAEREREKEEGMKEESTMCINVSLRTHCVE